MELRIGDKIHNGVPSHYYKHKIGEVKKISNTEIIVEYDLNGSPVIIHHNLFDLKYFEKVG